MKGDQKPMGPYSPPLPSEAEQDQGEPMAVARDKQNPYGESFLPTTADLDQFDADVARRYKQVREGTTGAGVTESREENRAQERPEGYTRRDENGWKKLAEME